MIIFLICLGAGSRQYCRYTKSLLGINYGNPFKGIWESPRVKTNWTSVGFEPMISGLDLPMLYRLSYEASTGAGRGNLDSESQSWVQTPTKSKFLWPVSGDSQIFFKGVIPKGDLVYRQYCLPLAPKHIKIKSFHNLSKPINT